MLRNSILIFVSCLISTSVFAAYPDGTTWIVAKKTCNGVQMAPSKDERIYFGNGIFARIMRATENQTQYCSLARAFLRDTQSFTGTQGNYQETDVLTPQAIRTACYDKANGSTISDKTSNWAGGNETLSVSLNGNVGSAQLVSSSECNGPLSLDLALKTN